MIRLARLARLTRLALVALAWPIAACTGDGNGPEGALEQALAHARPATVTSSEPTRVPATRVESRLTIGFASAHDHRSLAIIRRVDRDGDRYRVVDERVQTAPAVADPTVDAVARDKVESLFDGHALAWKRGDGQWIERDVLDGLATRTLAQALDLADFALGAFGDYMRQAPLAPDAEHPADIAGTRVTWTSVDLDPAVRPRALGDDERATLRDHEPTVPKWIAATHRPTSLRGDIARDAKGAIVAAHLTLAGETTFPDGPAKLTLELAQTTSPLPSDATFELPADRLPQSRERPWKMIEDVLGDGLLPPYRAP